jgi:transpeptidase family protein/MecA-like transpeptidase family protein
MRDSTVDLGKPVSRGRRRRIAVVAGVVVLIVALAAGVGGYLLLRTLGSPQQTAATYLRGWQQGNYPAMNKVSVHVPHGGVAGPLTAAAAQLGMRRIHLVPGPVTVNGGSAQERFTATADLASGHVWTYQGRLRLVKRNRHWWVDWGPSAIYPGLRAGERFVQHAVWPARAQVLAADGTVLSSPGTIARSGSLALLTGTVVSATAAQAKALGAPYQAGDQIGLGGVEQAYQEQLAGRPSLTIRIEGPGSHPDATAAHFPGSAGKAVRTSIDMRVQEAASQAVASAATAKPVDLVALQPSTGRVLAVVERPGGFDRALQGIFPPGSTFKVVTASALARAGLRPSSTVQCPGQVNIGGRTFHNFDNEHFGTTSLKTAFAVSCNTTFAMQATQRLDGRALASMAARYGFNARPALGIPATLGHFTIPHQPVDLAADAFGQGTDLVNPLSQAAMAAAVEDGTWRPPLLVTDPAPHQKAHPHKLSTVILSTLRPMMRAVVTIGTAAHVGLPPGVYGKTGTAEYGTGPNPPSHAWFIGYRGDLAFAVLVEGGGTGADKAGPIANAFLRKL